jgi:hypothetical protein
MLLPFILKPIRLTFVKQATVYEAEGKLFIISSLISWPKEPQSGWPVRANIFSPDCHCPIARSVVCGVFHAAWLGRGLQRRTLSHQNFMKYPIFTMKIIWRRLSRENVFHPLILIICLHIHLYASLQGRLFSANALYQWWLLPPLSYVRYRPG